MLASEHDGEAMAIMFALVFLALDGRAAQDGVNGGHNDSGGDVEGGEGEAGSRHEREANEGAGVETTPSPTLHDWLIPSHRDFLACEAVSHMSGTRAWADRVGGV